jgi:hypothetical protein
MYSRCNHWFPAPLAPSVSPDHLRRAYRAGPDNVLHEQLTQATSPKVSVTNILPDAGDGWGVWVLSPETTPTRIDPLVGNGVVGVLVPHHRVGKVVGLAVVGQLPDDGWFGSCGHVDWSRRRSAGHINKCQVILHLG